MNKEQYEKDLKRRQKEHLDRIAQRQDFSWRPCMHDACPDCIGTGIKQNGSSCVHMISCPCPKCTPYYMSTGSINQTICQQNSYTGGNTLDAQWLYQK